MSTVSVPTPTAAHPQTELARALLAAQAIIKAIPHDSRNEYHKYRYTSSEAIISECKAALAGNGLSLLPTGETHQVLGEGQVLLVRSFTLLHTSGEERQLTTSWPVVPDKGRPLDKATASAATTPWPICSEICCSHRGLILQTILQVGRISLQPHRRKRRRRKPSARMEQKSCSTWPPGSMSS